MAEHAMPELQVAMVVVVMMVDADDDASEDTLICMHVLERG
jgi:hypothetical protein